MSATEKKDPGDKLFHELCVLMRDASPQKEAAQRLCTLLNQAYTAYPERYREQWLPRFAQFHQVWKSPLCKLTQLEALAKWRAIVPLASFEFDGSGVGRGDEGVKVLMESSSLASVCTLRLSENEMGDSGAIAVATSPYLFNLNVLDLSHNMICVSGAMAIANAPLLGHVTCLNLEHNEIGDEGAKALAHSRYLSDPVREQWSWAL